MNQHRGEQFYMEQKIVKNGHERSARRSVSGPKMVDVALAAGVSPITISRTLKTPEKVSPQTREKVKKAMDAVGYIPNLVAGSLASTRSQIIGIVVPTITNSLFADTVEGLTNVIRPQKYHILIGSSRYDINEEEDIVRAFLGQRVEAMVLTGITHSAVTQRMLRQSQTPVVEMWAMTENPIDTVIGFSNFEAARQMTNYLIKRGYSHIAYLGGLTKNNDRTSQRQAGYEAAIRQAGLAYPDGYIRPTAFDFKEGGRAIRSLLDAHPEIDAVFAASDVLAVGAIQECLRQGWSVPERIAIAGLDDSIIAAELFPPLTTVRIPRYQIGEVIGNELLRRLTSPDAQVNQVIDLGFEIIKRVSA